MNFVINVASSGSVELSIKVGNRRLSRLGSDQALCLGEATLDGAFYFFGDVLLSSEADLLPRFGTGAFNVLKVGEGGYQVLQDRLGMRPLYIYERGEAVAVSDSLWALMETLRASGIRLGLNREAFELMLASDKFLAEHPLTMETLVEGVRVSIPGSTVTISAVGGVTEAPRTSFDRVGLREELYQDRLQVAVSEITANVRAPIDCGHFDHFYADITGGRDSRAVLAALRSADRIGAVRFRHRPCGMVEGFLAQSLIAISGGEFVSVVPGGTVHHVDPDEYLQEQFQYFMGTNHELRSRFSVREESSVPSVLFRGGLGEVYRNHYLNPVAREGRGLDFPFSGMLNKRSLLPPERQHAAIGQLQEGLMAMPGETEEEKLYWHYRYLRNRFHFGLANQSSSFHVINPLYSHAALDLAEQVPVDWLSSGRLMADLTAALDEELAGLPYASEFSKGVVPTRKFERMAQVVYNPAKKTWCSGIPAGGHKVSVEELVYSQTRELAEWYFDEIEPSEGGADKVRYMKGLEQNITKGKLKFVIRDWFKFRAARLLLSV